MTGGPGAQPGLGAAASSYSPLLAHRPGCLMDRKGKILIPGISEAVAPVTEEELELYDKIDFDLEEYARDVGAGTLLHGCKVPPTCQARSACGPGGGGCRLDRPGHTPGT